MQMYLAWLEYTSRLAKAGLAFCLPQVTTTKEIYAEETVDLALAGRLVQAGIVPVTNDFRLTGPERILVITGPNQGGKTTFARLFGQIHYLACLGLSVPGKRAQLYLFDHLFTHFEREEHLANLRGKLQDDLIRIHAILEQATPRSLLVINEMFASTTFQDALDLSQRIAARIMELDLLCVWVTFIDELSMLGEQTVSMMSTVVADNPAQRTFKIIRQPADGRAHAVTLAERHRLTYAAIMERVKR
jgi:DNA mismatch repair ATPase MutS